MALAVFAAPFSAAAQAPYPNQGIRFIVPYAPGGLPDTSRASPLSTCRSASVNPWWSRTVPAASPPLR